MRTKHAIYLFAGLFFLPFISHLLLAMANNIPLIFPDESGYIQIARRLVAGLPAIEPGNKFFPAYSLLIAPLFLLSQNIERIYPLIQLLNSALLSLLPLCIYKLLGAQSQRLSVLTKALVALIVSIYPSYILQSNVAVCENLLIVIFAALCWFMVRLSVDFTVKKNWLVCLLLLSILPMVHPRAIAASLSGLALLFFLLFSLARRQQEPIKRNLIYGVNAVILVAAVSLSFWINSRREIYGYGNQFFIDFYARLSLETSANFLLSICGTFWYLAVATLGLIWCGLLPMAKRVFNPKIPFAEKLYEIFVLLSLVSVLLISKVSEFLTNQEIEASNRADWLIYGRYLEPFILPFLVEGVLLLKNLKLKDYLKPQFFITLPLCCLIYVFRAANLDQHYIFSYQILGIAFMKILDPGYFLDTGKIICAYALLSVVIILSLKFARKAAPGILAGYYLANALTAYFLFFAWNTGNIKTNQAHLIAPMRMGLDLSQKKCIGHDQGLVFWYPMFSVYLTPEMAFLPGETANCDLYLTGNLKPPTPEARLIGLQKNTKYLWALSADLIKAMSDRGWILPKDFPSSLPEAASRASIRVHASQACAADAKACFTAEIKHLGAMAFWPASAFLREGYGVALQMRAYDSRSRRTLLLVKSNLERNFYPGDQGIVLLNLREPVVALLCAAKTFYLQFNLAQQNVGEFLLASDQGRVFKGHCNNEGRLLLEKNPSQVYSLNWPSFGKNKLVFSPKTSPKPN